jgi:Ca2+-binding EF-hand superfamily protein
MSPIGKTGVLVLLFAAFTAMADEKDIGYHIIPADADGNGTISDAEALAFFGANLADEKQEIALHNAAVIAKYDKNANGKLDPEELAIYREFWTKVCRKYNENPKQRGPSGSSATFTSAMYKCMAGDTDKNGQMSDKEAALFFSAMLDVNKDVVQKFNADMLNEFDKDGNQQLSKEELVNYLKQQEKVLAKLNKRASGQE